MDANRIKLIDSMKMIALKIEGHTVLYLKCSPSKKTNYQSNMICEQLFD